MKLLALDQASKTTGYAIFDNDKLIKCGHFTCNDNDLGIRLLKIREFVDKTIDEYNINQVIMEDIQLEENRGNNVQTFKILAEVFGVIYELLIEKDIKVDAVLAVQWRSKLGIKGKLRPEQKRNAQLYIQNKYGLMPTEDEADAACIGNYFLYQNNLISSSQDFDWS